MLLTEMFSPIGAPKEDQQEIDWLDDLKFYIDNDQDALTKQLFPTVDKHKQYIDHPKAYTLYIKPISRCLEDYCKKYEIEQPEEKFSKEKLIELAKRICEEQADHIKNGDYDFK